MLFRSAKALEAFNAVQNVAVDMKKTPQIYMCVLTSHLDSARALSFLIKARGEKSAQYLEEFQGDGRGKLGHVARAFNNPLLFTPVYEGSPAELLDAVLEVFPRADSRFFDRIELTSDARENLVQWYAALPFGSPAKSQYLQFFQ